jgi:YteA family regulatory protein
MNKNDMEVYKTRLMNQKKSIKATIKDMKENGLNLSQKDEVSELSTIDNHPADMGTEMFDKERYYALIDNEKSMLHQIDLALDRIKDGVYGKCEFCGKEIEGERLNFSAAAITCIACENKRPDYNTYRYDRPVEEKTMAPFGRYFMDIYEEEEYEHDVGYNAEDTWQDVDKYNVRNGIERNYEDDLDGMKDQDDAGDDTSVVEFTDKISNQYYKQQLP